MPKELIKVRRPVLNNSSTSIPNGPITYELKDFGFNPKLIGEGLGDGVKISVIATGVPEHRDFTNIENFECFIEDTDSPNDEHGLSTIISGVIGANNPETGLVGLAPRTSLYFAKALSDNGSGDDKSVISSILWSILKKVDIILLPFEFNHSPPNIHKAVKKAYESNICIFAPLGKRNYEEAIFPACYPEVMGVCCSPNEFSDTINVKIPKELYTTCKEKHYIKANGVRICAAVAASAASIVIENLKDSKKNFSPRDVFHTLNDSLSSQFKSIR